MATKLTEAQRKALDYFAEVEARNAAVRIGAPVPTKTKRYPDPRAVRAVYDKRLVENHGSYGTDPRLTPAGRALVGGGE